MLKISGNVISANKPNKKAETTGRIRFSVKLSKTTRENAKMKNSAIISNIFSIKYTIDEPIYELTNFL